MGTESAVGEQRIGDSEERELLLHFCKEICNGDLEQAGLVLGREPKDLAEMLAGEQKIDEDLVMKVRGIAQERGLDI